MTMTGTATPVAPFSGSLRGAPTVAPGRDSGKPWLPLAGALLGLIAAGLALHLGQRVATDSYSYYVAVRALVTGGNPYIWVTTDFPAFYPLPAYLILAPLGWLPAWGFHLASAGLAGLALGVAANRRPALAPALLSAGFFADMANGQWPVVLLAGVAVPGLRILWSCKPSVGLALFAGYPSRAALVGGGILALISLALFPRWPLDWLHNLGQAPHVAPILRPGGFLLLLAFLRWRQPEARMLGLLALIPHTVGVGDAILAFACCRTKWEGYGLALVSYGAAFWAASRLDPSMMLAYSQDRQWVPILVGCYLPALCLVLRGSSWRVSSS